jgi:hypothetical protein
MLSSYISTCRLILQAEDSCGLYGFSDVLQPIDTIIFVTRHLHNLPNFNSQTSCYYTTPEFISECILPDGGHKLVARTGEKAEERGIGVILGIIPEFSGRHWRDP